jgi:hypothetical protein
MNAPAKPAESETRPAPARSWNEELADVIATPPPTWQEPEYDAFHYARVGLLLGLLGGCTSLVVNVIGSVLWPAISGAPQHPLRLIQVFLTFPLGESALQLDSGLVLALGCVLYLITGMLYGMLFALAISYILPHAGLTVRLMACSILALAVWAVNFYLLISWLQPLLLGGRWIAELIPWWVAAITHLVFGWTVATLYPIARPVLREATVENQTAR